MKYQICHIKVKVDVVSDRNSKKKHCENKKMKIWLICMKIGACMGCHQRPDRSFFYHNYQFPVCARCTGCFIGYLMTLIVWRIYKTNMLTCICLCLPMLIDWGLQYKNIRESTQLSRLVTGILGGIGVFSFEIDMIVKLLKWGGVL